MVLQSVPAEQAQLFSGPQEQPVPVQTAGPRPASLVEQARVKPVARTTYVNARFMLASYEGRRPWIRRRSQAAVITHDRCCRGRTVPPVTRSGAREGVKQRSCC